MKKFVSMLVVLAMVLSMVPAVFAAETATSGTIEAVAGADNIYTTDTWTAETDGVLTISVNSEEGVGYKVYVNGEAQSLMWAMTYSDTVSVEVNAGDAVYLEVRGNNPDSWAYCDATIHWAYSFAAGGTVKEPYAIAMNGEEHLVVGAMGASQIPMIATAEVTVVTFSPAEAGVYTITVGDGATIGNCGSTSALISTDVEFGASVEWTCQQAGYWTETEIPAEDFQSSGEWITIEQYISGQSLMLGIVSDSENVTINVEKTGDYIAPVTTEVVYENKATLTQFAVPADATMGGYVDVYGDTHTAVLGSDGYYHLDSADGDILLVDMDYTFTLSDALNSDRPVMYAYVKNADGSTTRYDIGNAVLAYEAVCDENGYYPLTEDLMFFYQVYAADVGIFQYCLDANYNPDCAWMFACMTMSLPGQDSGLEGSGTEEDPYIIPALPYTIEVSYTDDAQADAGVFFQYTPEKSGSITIKDFNDEINMGILTEVNEWVHLTDTNYLAVTAGTPVVLLHWGVWAGDYDLTLEFTESTGDDPGDNPGGDEPGDTPGGGDDTPVADVITEETVWADTDVAVTADAPVVFTFTAGVDGTLTGTISAKDTGWQFDIVDADENYMSTMWSDITPNAINETLTAGTTYTVTISGYDEVSWDIIDGTLTYELTFTPAGGTEVEGSGTEEDPYVLIVDGTNHASVAEGRGQVVYFIWTAEENGTLTLTFDENDPTPWVTPYIGGIADAEGNGGYVHAFELTAGTTVMIGVETYDYIAAEFDFQAAFEAGTTGPEPGSIDDPYEISMDEIYMSGEAVDTVSIAADASAYYNLLYFADSTVTVTGEGDFTVRVCSYVMDENWEEVPVWTSYESVDGVVEFYAAEYVILVEIVNNGAQAAAYAVNYYYPIGHMENPQVITGEGTWTAELPANSNGHFFKWTVGDDAASGLMTITVNGQSWQYYVENTTQFLSGDYHYSSDKPQVKTETHTVFAGDVFNIWVNTNYKDVENNDYDCPEGTVTFSISFEEKNLVQGVDYPYAVSRYDGPGEVPVAAGDEVWVELSGFYGYYAVVSGEGAYLIYNGTTYNAVDGVLQVMINDYTADVTLGNASGAAVTYTIEGAAPLGKSDNPELITGDGTYTTSEFPANGFYNYYFQYTATQAGTVTVEVLNDTNWRIQVWNPETYASVGGNSKGSTNTYSLKVNVGDVIQIYGAPYDPASYQVVAGTLSFKFSFEVSADAPEVQTLADGDNTVTLDNVDGSLTASNFAYTATQTGTLYLTFSDVTYWTSYNGELGEATEGSKSNIVDNTKVLVNGEALENGYFGAIDVAAGDVVTIIWNFKYASYTWKMTANLNLNYEGYDPAPGSEQDPIDVYFHECFDEPVQTVEIAAGSTAHYTLHNFYGYYLTVTGEGAYVVFDGTTYTDEDGDGVITLACDDYEMQVEIGNAGTAAASFAIGGAYPVGNQNNPEKIGDGDYTVTVKENDENYFFSYDATCDGFLDITVAGDSWSVMIYNATTNQFFVDGAWDAWGGAYESSNYAALTATISVDVVEGDEIQIAVNTLFTADDPEGLWGSSPAGTINVSVAAKYDHEDKNHDGKCDYCGAEVESDSEIGDVIYGDVNGDGDIDLMDANLVVSYYNELVELSDEQFVAADVNGDGDVDIMDANMIVAYYNEVRDSFPVEE